MKGINFAHAHKSSIASLWPTLFFSFIIIAVISSFQFQQWIVLRELKKQKTMLMQESLHFDNIIAEKNQLVNQEHLTKTKITKIEKIKKNQHRFFSLYSQINKALGTTGSLEKLSLEKKKLNLTICCPHIKKATRFMETINKLPSVAFLRFVSIYPNKSKMLFTIAGKLS